MIPVWHVLDRETGELIDTAAPGSQMDKALLAGSPAVLFSHEVAHNTLTGEVVYRSGAPVSYWMSAMVRDATSAGHTGRGFEATR